MYNKDEGGECETKTDEWESRGDSDMIYKINKI